MMPHIDASRHAPVALGAAPAPARPLRVALLGFGTVGQAVTRVLAERTDLRSRLRLTHVFNRNVARKQVAWVGDAVRWTDDIDEVFGAGPDVVVEVVGGVSPAGDWVRRAIAQRASVVTANKLLMAAQGRELLRLAAAHGGEIRFEASVAGGVPLINAVRQGLAGDVITGVAGILNGTCNYILSQIATAGTPFADALLEAQRLGYAEADPSSDIDGLDAAAKLSVLAGVAFNRHLRLGNVATASIACVDPIDFVYARRLRATIRQLSLVTRHNETLHASVGPALVPESSVFGRNDGVNNVIAVSGRYGGITTYSGAGAGGNATAVSIVSDLLAMSRAPAAERVGWRPARIGAAPPRAWYVRFVVRDRPGILAAITAALARHEINVDAVLQEPGYDKDRLPFVVTVERCSETDLRSALNEMPRADFASAPVVLPFLEEMT